MLPLRCVLHWVLPACGAAPASLPVVSIVLVSIVLVLIVPVLIVLVSIVGWSSSCGSTRGTTLVALVTRVMGWALRSRQWARTQLRACQQLNLRLLERLRFFSESGSARHF